MTVSILLGDALEVLKTLPACSVQCAVTSPPYYGLRDYGVSGQIGLEDTPEAYIAKLVDVFREVKRVLKDDGTLWVNMGDSYWGGKGQSAQAWSTEHQDRETLEQSQHQITGIGETRPTDRKHESIKPKDLIGIPWMLAFALRADGWWLRSDIIWAKPNPMPESVTDRPTKSHEYIFLLSKSARYYYDNEAIKELSKYPDDDRGARAAEEHKRFPSEKVNGIRASGLYPMANKRSVWTVTTKPYKGAHFATYPPDLIEPCILAGSKAGDTVLDPFNGSGTTGEVAIKHGRNYIGIELKPDYIELTHKRLAKVQPMLDRFADAGL
jgi:DNA modification methylase